MSEQVLLMENAVAEVSGIRVGLHSAWAEEFEADGVKRNGPRATVCVMGDEPENDFDIRVHVGLSLTVAGDSWRVTQIAAPDHDRGTVLLEKG